MARPAYEPTEKDRKTVEAMTGYGIKQPDICRVLGITEKTLRKHFAAQIATGTTRANATVAEALYKQALGSGRGATAAAIFWLKSRAGWRETIDLANSEPLTVKIVRFGADAPE